MQHITCNPHLLLTRPLAPCSTDLITVITVTLGKGKNPVSLLTNTYCEKMIHLAYLVTKSKEIYLSVLVNISISDS